MSNPFNVTTPVLYSFRRCPYAMRARMALKYCRLAVELREVVLRDKPACMVNYSPKATVPVLVIPRVGGEAQVIDESIDIMQWSLEISLRSHSEKAIHTHHLDKQIGFRDDTLRVHFDSEFKYYLDHYKYYERYPENSQAYYRDKAMISLERLEDILSRQRYLSGIELGFLDISIMPFVRQFAHVDLSWFEQSGFASVITWLEIIKGSELFTGVMTRYPQWFAGDEPIMFPLPSEPLICG